MRAIRWTITGLFTVVAIIITGVALALHGHSTGWIVTKRSVETWIEALEPHLQIERPTSARANGDGHPVVLIFPGCGGVRDHHTTWAQLAASEGFIGIVVDSNTPRGIDRGRAMREICSGARFWGRERAGDVVAMLAWVATLPDADPNRVVLMGQSHGAWAVMDLMAMTFPLERPTGLRRPLPENIRQQVDGAVLFYPYCGAFSMSDEDGWALSPPSLMILAGEDDVVSTLACQEVAGDLQSAGLPLDVVLLKEAGHAFDEPDLPVYRSDLTRQSEDRVRTFLRQIKTTP